MKTFKTFLAVSVLSTVATAANAYVWEFSMNSSTPFPPSNGPLNLINFTGQWDDSTNLGVWTGTVEIPGLDTTAHYSQTFTMNKTTGEGYLNPHDVTTCTSNNANACAGLVIYGDIFNTVGTSDTDYQTPLGFTPTDGWSGTWTLQVYKMSELQEIIYIPTPMNIHFDTFCLDYCYEPEPDPVVTPIPDSAWLLGSGLIGLLGAARRKTK